MTALPRNFKPKPTVPIALPASINQSWAIVQHSLGNGMRAGRKRPARFVWESEQPGIWQSATVIIPCLGRAAGIVATNADESKLTSTIRFFDLPGWAKPARCRPDDLAERWQVSPLTEAMMLIEHALISTAAADRDGAVQLFRTGRRINGRASLIPLADHIARRLADHPNLSSPKLRERRAHPL